MWLRLNQHFIIFEHGQVKFQTSFLKILKEIPSFFFVDYIYNMYFVKTTTGRFFYLRCYSPKSKNCVYRVNFVPFYFRPLHLQMVSPCLKVLLQDISFSETIWLHLLVWKPFSVIWNCSNTFFGFFLIHQENSK